jgi:hypothetical protein
MERSQEEDRIEIDQRAGTPPRPPYSPVTPVFADLAPVPGSTTIVPPGTEYFLDGCSDGFPDLQRPPGFAPESAPIPISESENPDVIALRSAISILQLQKKQSLQDIGILDRMRIAAVAEPEKFAQELVSGKLASDGLGGLISLTNEDNWQTAQSSNVSTADRASSFGKLPRPQNVIRMPPINWAKYQIVGEPLDKLHEELRRRPSIGEPRRDESALRVQGHILAAPYRPFIDKIDSPLKGRGMNKGKKTRDE